MSFSQTLYQIFYDVNKFDKREDISKCHPYMLTKENVEKWLAETMATNRPAPAEEQQTIPEIQKKSLSSSVYYPKQKNSLFWCVYIGVYGMGEYLINERKSANAEMQERQKMLDYFREPENMSKLKQGNTKVSNVLIQEIMADIMVSTRDPNSIFHMLIALSVYHRKIIYFVRKNKYVVFSFSKCKMEESEIEEYDISNTLLIYAKNDKECGLCEELSIAQIQDIIENKYRLECYDKPLRGISSYRIPELESIAKKLNVDCCDDNGISLKKNELYNKILIHSTW